MTIILNIPENEKNLTFLWKNSFKKISKEELTVEYPYPDRNSGIYQKSEKILEIISLTILF